jgi:hypothetical protein
MGDETGQDEQDFSGFTGLESDFGAKAARRGRLALPCQPFSHRVGRTVLGEPGCVPQRSNARKFSGFSERENSRLSRGGAEARRSFRGATLRDASGGGHAVEVPDFPTSLGGPDSPTPQGRGGLGGGAIRIVSRAASRSKATPEGSPRPSPYGGLALQPFAVCFCARPSRTFENPELPRRGKNFPRRG